MPADWVRPLAPAKVSDRRMELGVAGIDQRLAARDILSGRL